MRRILVLLGFVLMLVPAFGGCGVTEEGGLQPDGGAGTTGDGGGGLGGGQCFPGSKLCPDPKDPLQTKCVTAEEPANGCSQSTACAPCTLPHATAKCATGFCAVDVCDAGWADCNTSAIDGCETDLTGDKNHCGTCTTDCVAASGPGWICKAGICEVNQCCPDGNPACLTKDDCDGNKQNGCEVDKANDPANCKTCGNVCALAHASAGCSQEVCVVTSCNSGWANCDTNDVNGCEININQGDKANCGACNKKCNETTASATCISGTCALQCAAGFGNCNNNPDDSCEINLKTNPLHCNGCNNACNPANVNNVLCTNGACDYDSCKNGFADCDNNRANGCEINILQNVNHCNGCGKKCTAPSGGSVLCSNGSCAESCSAGLTNCGGVCVPTATDTNHCGGCGNACTPPVNSAATCSGGTCGFNCNPGWAKCGSSTQCFQNGSDPTHCCSGGGCNTSCNNCPGPGTGTGTATCNTGTCNFTCSAPTLGKCSGGCFNFTDDESHCGSCTTVCTAPANGTNTCIASTCTIACNNNFHKCGNACKADNDATACGASCQNCPAPTGTGSATCNNGTCGMTCSGGTPDLCGSACVNKQTSVAHCGSCGNACNPGELCCGGSCKTVATDENFCGNCTTSCNEPTETCCGGVCKDTDADESNCQSCGTQCGAGKYCCDGGCNGVQNDTSANANNCGPSCTDCTGGKSCVNGVCT